MTRSERCRHCKFFSEDCSMFISVIHCKKGNFEADDKEMNNNFTKHIEHGNIEAFPIECTDFEDNLE